MKQAVAFSLLLVPLLSCSSTSEAPAPSMTAEGEDKSADKARELDALERKLTVARARLAKTQLEQDLADKQHAVKLRHAKAAVEIAEAGLTRFRDADAPNELARLRLNLRSAKDRAQEAAEELEQIKIMYDEQDLDDLTAEFVVSRGQRSAERAAARIEIEENQLRTVEEREHPVKLRELTLAVERAVAELEKLEMEGVIAQQGQAIALQEAENEIVRLEHELVQKREEVGS